MMNGIIETTVRMIATTTQHIAISQEDLIMIVIRGTIENRGTIDDRIVTNDIVVEAESVVREIGMIMIIIVNMIATIDEKRKSRPIIRSWFAI